LQNLFGFVPRIFRLQHAIPGILQSQIQVLEALLGEDPHLSRTQKERVLLTVSVANRSSYGVALHEQMLQLVGGQGGEGQDAELTAFAQKLVLQPAEIRQSDIDRLLDSGFTRAQIVGVVVLVGFGNFLNTTQAGFGAVPDFTVRPIFQTVKPDNKVHPPESKLRPTIEGVTDDPDLEELISAQKGDVGAFETLVGRHSQRVYRTLVGFLGNPDDARDAMQDAFLNAYRNLGRFERRSRFATWLTTIASNVGLQRLRDRKKLVSLDDDGSDQEEYRPRQIRAWEDDPEQRYSKAEQRDLVERAIARLPAKYRVVVILRDVQQLSTEETAAALGLSVPAVKARLLRARLMLRETLAPHFTEGAQSA
jgi:RNA polymerase sigma-70 factor (ECF subfamily)